MIAFTKRNLKLYFRDRAAVLFSLLAVFIIIGLYILFLGDVWTNDLKPFNHAKELMDNWIMAGVLAITSVTTTLGILGTMVRDKADKIEKDFYAAPIRSAQITGGYMLSAYLVGLLMSLLTLVIAELYLISSGNNPMSLTCLFKVLLALFLTSLMNTSMMFFLVSFFQSMNAYTSASTIVGTLIGFLTGIYLPIGMLPSAVQWIVKLFPASHAALIFRNLMMEASMEQAFFNVPKATVLNIKKHLGLVYSFGDYHSSIWFSVFFMIAITLLFFFLINIKMQKISKY